MCIAVSGVICEMNGAKAKVNILGNILEVNTKLVNANIGDYLLIHAGCAIEVIDKSKSDELNEIYALLEEANNESK